jgi:hypothetical protein
VVVWGECFIAFYTPPLLEIESILSALSVPAASQSLRP